MAWTPIAVIGDSDPIANFGGVVYESEDGTQYDVRYFSPWTKDDGEEMVSVYEFSVADDVVKDLKWVDWKELAKSSGIDEQELRQHARSSDPVARAQVYEAVGQYYGVYDFAGEPDERTLDEAEANWGKDVEAGHQYRRTKHRARRGQEVATALEAINKYRATFGQRPLDPAAWSEQDILDEAARVRTLNPRALKQRLLRH